MNKIGVAMFLAGATVGSVAAWLCLRKRYEKIAQEEIDSVKAVFSKQKAKTPCGKVDGDSDKKQIEPLKPDIVDYAVKLQEEGYVDYCEHSSKKDEGKGKTMQNKFYIISPDKYNEYDDYDQISLIYYIKDGVILDEEGEDVEYAEKILGIDGGIDEHFGEYEDDSVFIRNDYLRCNYEILKDNRHFYEVVRNYQEE